MHFSNDVIEDLIYHKGKKLKYVNIGNCNIFGYYDDNDYSNYIYYSPNTIIMPNEFKEKKYYNITYLQSTARLDLLLGCLIFYCEFILNFNSRIMLGYHILKLVKFYMEREHLVIFNKFSNLLKNKTDIVGLVGKITKELYLIPKYNVEVERIIGFITWILDFVIIRVYLDIILGYSLWLAILVYFVFISKQFIIILYHRYMIAYIIAIIFTFINQFKYMFIGK